jgi:hypothetical protein
VVLVIDFELDSLHACVEEVQRRTTELEVASAWQEVTGNDGAMIDEKQRRRSLWFRSWNRRKRERIGAGEEAGGARVESELGFGIVSVGIKTKGKVACWWW